jgi:cell volume regulation protein A
MAAGTLPAPLDDDQGEAVRGDRPAQVRVTDVNGWQTAFVFVVLGANIPFDDLGEHFLPAMAVLATLLLLARPLVVIACTLPDRQARWTRQEILFLCWTRETGVVPAALVGVLAGLGVPDVEIYASVVALAVVLTLLLQALPATRLAGRLGLLEPRTRTVAGSG